MAAANPIPMSPAISQAPAGQTLQLQDIQTPEQVSNLPLAPGWWILLVIIILATIFVVRKLKKSKELNRVKKQALAQLNNKTMNAKSCIALLKWAAMHYFSREKLAKLYGNSFQLFLQQQLPEKHQAPFKQLSDAGFLSQYQANASDTVNENSDINNTDKASSSTISKTDKDFQQATKLWLTYALPVKNHQESNND